MLHDRKRKSFQAPRKVCKLVRTTFDDWGRVPISWSLLLPIPDYLKWEGTMEKLSYFLPHGLCSCSFLCQRLVFCLSETWLLFIQYIKCHFQRRSFLTNGGSSSSLWLSVPETLPIFFMDVFIASIFLIHNPHPHRADSPRCRDSTFESPVECLVQTKGCWMGRFQNRIVWRNFLEWWASFLFYTVLYGIPVWNLYGIISRYWILEI